jgi:A/G-specific adenine glycosylase
VLNLSQPGRLSEELVRWWRGNNRHFPWRGESTPFRVLFAEFLLRRTTARQVADRYQQLVDRYGSLGKLLEVSTSELERDLNPLGLYRVRARQLKEMASALAERHGGEVPSDRPSLEALPGVSSYIAGAVMCFGFHQKVPIVDTNIDRVLRRLHAGKGRLKDKDLWHLADIILPETDCREHNFALLDLAAIICRPRNPSCPSCPISKYCDHFQLISTSPPQALDELKNGSHLRTSKEVLEE